MRESRNPRTVVSKRPHVQDFRGVWGVSILGGVVVSHGFFDRNCKCIIG